MKNLKLDKFLYGVGIVVATGGLISAIFDKDKNLHGKVQELEERIKLLENK